jgi:hypothetical protein
METTHLTHYTVPHPFSANEFEEAYYNSRLRYSLRHLAIIENISHEFIMEALQKSLKVCHLLSINSDHHFKKIYVFDSISETLHTDWIMSRNGFNLMVMQIPSMNEKIAEWIWELAD